MKRFATTAAVLISVLATGACTGLPAMPEAAGVLSCGGGSLQTSVSPAITVAQGTRTLTSTSPSTSAPCTDGTGAGITTATIESLSVSFSSLSCSGSDRVGHGSARVRWSDGTSSTANVLALLDTALTGNFTVQITSGRLDGYHGSADFIAAPSAGDCISGITAETITIGGLALRAS